MKKVFILFCYLIASSVLLSCQKSMETPPNFSEDANFKVSLNQAKAMCESSQKNAKLDASKQVESANTKKNNKGENMYHVITYKENKGYRVVSADKRAFPLLVESEKGKFDTTVNGVAIWMHGLEGYIATQRTKEIEKDEDKYLKSLWKDFEDTGDPLKQIKSKKNAKLAFPDDSGTGGGYVCQYQYLSNENKLETMWGQGCGYNNLFPPDGCGGLCGKIPAGCGAVAMAQIMFRHQKAVGSGATFNFYDITDNAKLIKYAADKAGSFSVTVGCSTSTATLPWVISSAFSNSGYSYGGFYNDYYFGNDVLNDLLYPLNTNYPIILSGTKGWIGNLNEWHIWVADGVRYWTWPSENGSCFVGGQLHFNMGWNEYQDSWYYSPYQMGYDTQLKMITNIRP